MQTASRRSAESARQLKSRGKDPDDPRRSPRSIESKNGGLGRSAMHRCSGASPERGRVGGKTERKGFIGTLRSRGRERSLLYSRSLSLPLSLSLSRSAQGRADSHGTRRARTQRRNAGASARARAHSLDTYKGRGEAPLPRVPTCFRPQAAVITAQSRVVDQPGRRAAAATAATAASSPLRSSSSRWLKRGGLSSARNALPSARAFRSPPGSGVERRPRPREVDGRSAALSPFRSRLRRRLVCCCSRKSSSMNGERFVNWTRIVPRCFPPYRSRIYARRLRASRNLSGMKITLLPLSLSLSFSLSLSLSLSCARARARIRSLILHKVAPSDSPWLAWLHG